MKKIVFLPFLICILLLINIDYAKALNEFSEEKRTIVVDDKLIDGKVKMIVYEDKLFVPLRFITEQLKNDVLWNQKNKQAIIHTKIGDVFKLTTNNKNIVINEGDFEMDVSPILYQNKMYVPLRLVGEINHTKISEKNNTVFLQTVPLHTVKKKENLYKIAMQYDVLPEDILVRNQLQSEKLVNGQQLKIVIPYPMSQSQQRLDILAKIVEAEARGESMEGKMAVGNVILNRVKSDAFPSTIRGVVFQENQFTPIKNGVFAKTLPKKESYEAAKRVIEGENIVGEALYFYNPKKTTSTFFNKLTKIETIGNHVFLK